LKSFLPGLKRLPGVDGIFFLFHKSYTSGLVIEKDSNYLFFLAVFLRLSAAGRAFQGCAIAPAVLTGRRLSPLTLMLLSLRQLIGLKLRKKMLFLEQNLK
jgi:hypothetical protein